MRSLTFAVVGCAGWAFFIACSGDDPNPTNNGQADASSSSTSSGGSSSGSASSDAEVDSFVPSTCAPGTVRCEGAQVQVCNLEGTGYVVQKLCDTAALCRTSGGGSCEPPACATDATRCNGAIYEKCNNGRTAWEKVTECASPALCNQNGTGDAGVGCTAPACAAGARYCDFGCAIIPQSTNDCLLKCKADRTGYELEENCGSAQGGDRCMDDGANSKCI